MLQKFQRHIQLVKRAEDSKSSDDKFQRDEKKKKIGKNYSQHLSLLHFLAEVNASEPKETLLFFSPCPTLKADAFGNNNTSEE